MQRRNDPKWQKKRLEIALSKYPPYWWGSITDSINATTDPDFFCMLKYIMRQKPGLIEGIVDDLWTEINTKKGPQQ